MGAADGDATRSTAIKSAQEGAAGGTSSSPTSSPSVSSTASAASGSQLNDDVVKPLSTLHETSPSSDPTSLPGRKSANVRNASAKIASLRAAFETDPVSGAEGSIGTERRVPSNELKGDERAEREREYGKEITQLRNERDKEAELRKVYENKCVELEAVLEKLTQETQANGVKAAGNGLENDEGMESPAQELHVAKMRPREVQELERQVADLKRSISTSTRVERVVTDSTVAEEMGLLHYELQNWIVNNFRRAKVDASEVLAARLESVADATAVGDLRLLYADFEAAQKLAIYQATATYYMMEIFSCPLLFGVGDEQGWRTNVQHTAESLSALLSTESYNKWRALTFDVVRMTDSLQGGVDAAGSAVAEKICKALGAVTGIEASDVKTVPLNKIIKRAIGLAHLCRVQRPQYDFHLPSPGHSFDVTIMEEVMANDCNDHVPGSVRCAAFPSVTKVGDELGANSHLRNVIVKAKVLCKDSWP